MLIQLEHVAPETLQGKHGDYRYQLRRSYGELGPWFLDIYNDAKSTPGNVDLTRIPNLPDRSAYDAAMAQHVFSIMEPSPGIEPD